VSINFGGNFSVAAFEPSCGLCRGSESAATLSACPVNTAAHVKELFSASIFHRRASLSLPAVASQRPDQSVSRVRTVSVWPRRMATSWKVVDETRLTFSELVAMAIREESGGRYWRSRIWS
jgi:hypothetical protein